ncbi:YTH domain-containing protein ECT4-like isoform X2 [Magnolia sinica]|uniref:YTH domain-containing protein ECT4-like isoform X2 n=1 Tax=Magnolia sinica TaxID=86752 RepID=UPI00265B6441|nr:YTH domain-containing protein ECT4-like isoform X2 [Magnolia sinica]
MATTQQAPDRIISTGSVDILTLDAEEKTAEAETFKEQPISTKGEKMVYPNISHDSTTMGPSRDTAGHQGSLGTGGDRSAVYPSNVYAPQAQTQSFYYGGYDNAGEWDEYSRYVNAEGVEIGSPGIYNESPSLMFHPGYGYSPQVPYGPYSPVTTPLPNMRSDGPLYSPQQFPHTGPYYQQPLSPGMPYITSPIPMSQAELSIPTGIEQQGVFLTDSPNSNGVLFGPRPGYPLPYGSFSRGNFAGSSGNPPVYDLQQGYDVFGSGGPWSDWSKSSDGQRSLTPLSSPAASPQPIGTAGSFGHNTTPSAAGMASSQQRPLYGFGSAASSYSRGYPHGGMYHQGMNFSGSISSLGVNGRSWITIDKGRRRGRVSGSLCSCNGTLDVLGEQNKGPRASRAKNQTSERNSSVDTKNGVSTPDANSELYNRPDFVPEYKDAKFFIIKSYSEDNVHKSIKYGVWASTTSGNRKLDAAYRESKEKEGACPVFLLFSVNASAQFCGVAEMMGLVDFDKSVDYWQQDKWSGQFPVKWHIIKDVPNSQFRHIILENNDNKPVTNSRDTQEVGLEQGLEMLNIFKNYESDVSILDDFDFYEDRQKAMQERKARQQANLVAAPAAAGIEHRTPVPFSGDLMKQMSKSFAQVVRLEDSCKEDTTSEKAGSAAPAGVKPEDPIKTTAAAASQSS